MLEMKDSERLMRKVDKNMPIFNCTSKLRRLAWLLITLLMCQSGFSFAAQCDDYPAEVSSVPEQSKSIGTYDVPEKNVNAGDNTSSEESKCFHCVLCQCGQIKFLAQHPINDVAKPLCTNQYSYSRNVTDGLVEGLLRPPQH